MILSDLQSPALLVDLDRLERNLTDVAGRARASGVALRPHWKTHKSPDIARLQLEHGAVGGTVAKPSEALAFLEAGFTDLLIATPVVDPRKIDAVVAAAAARNARVTVLVESSEGAALWGEGASRASRTVPVRLEVDTGHGRTGVARRSGAVPLAREVAANPGLDLEGIMTHAGHAYGAGSPEEVPAIGRAEGEDLVATAEAIRAEGIACPVVSVGSTPTARHVVDVPGVTELRCGNYVFHDAIQVALGVVPPERCALTVLGTVLARPAPDRAVLDTGSKTLTTDTRGPDFGFGRLLDRPEARIGKLWEEHGVISGPAAADLRVGDRVRLIPNHACVTVNLHDRLTAVRGEEVVAEWPVAARGLVA